LKQPNTHNVTLSLWDFPAWLKENNLRIAGRGIDWQPVPGEPDKLKAVIYIENDTKQESEQHDLANI
jgi:predicted double-glycine peptidase